MMMLFTSAHCIWCQALKTMIAVELEELQCTVRIHEVDIQKQERIAHVYGVSVVPTLIADDSRLTGLPSASDLRSFILNVASETSDSPRSPPELIRAVQLQQGPPLGSRKEYEDAYTTVDTNGPQKGERTGQSSSKREGKFREERETIIT